jgi:hypothetical protein
MHNKKVLIDALKKLGSAKAPSKPKDIITDPMGQWKFPGQNTRIPSNDITMEGVPYPVFAQPNVGPGVMMYPGQDYHFPDADYVDETPQMKAGGALLTKKVTCKKCGWKWDAADGGDDITTCHKCGGQGLVHAQDGGDTDAMNGMMKARLAYANEFGNPAAKRMINLPDNPYQFDNGDTGTHYMASMDNYAVPQIQDENGQLMLGDYGPESREAMRFESDEDADYFAKHYKDVSPGFMNIELSPKEIEEYAKGGFIIEDISVPELTKAQTGKEIIKLGKKVLKNTYKINPVALKSTPSNIKYYFQNGLNLEPHWLKGYPKVAKKLSPTEFNDIASQIPYGKNYPVGPTTDIEREKIYDFLSKTRSKNDLVNKSFYQPEIFPLNNLKRYSSNIPKTEVGNIKREDLFSNKTYGIPRHRSNVNFNIYGDYDKNRKEKLFLNSLLATAGILGTGIGIGVLAGDPTKNAINRKINYPLYPTNSLSDPNITSKDTLINLNENQLDYGQMKDTPEGRILLGGDFVGDAENTVRPAKDWLDARYDDTYGDDDAKTKNVKSFYGIQDGQLILGTPKSFKPNTKIVPNRYDDGRYINKAKIADDHLRLVDKNNKPIYHNTVMGGKIILHSKDNNKSIFISYKPENVKNTVNQINNFIKNNNNVKPIIIDNGRFVNWMHNEDGLNKVNYSNFYSNDFQRGSNAGYNIILKKEGGELTKAQKGITKKSLAIADPEEYAYRKKAYDDSLKLYNVTNNRHLEAISQGAKLKERNDPGIKHFLKELAGFGVARALSADPNIRPNKFYDYIYPNGELGGGSMSYEKPTQPIGKIIKKPGDPKYVAPANTPPAYTGYPKTPMPYKNTVPTITYGNQQFLKGGALLKAQKGKTVKPFVVSEKEKKIYEDAYNKKYPPIILNDPNDSRIGWFTKEGNKYIYVPLVKKEILIKPTKNQIVPGKIIRKPGDPNYVPHKENGGELEQAPGGGQVAKLLKNLTRTNNVISRPIKKIGYNIAAQSALPFRTGEEIRKGILGTSKDKYFGQVYDIKNLYGPGKRDLNKLYFFGDETGFEPIDYDFSADSGLNKMIEKYGPLKSFLLNSEIKHNQPVNAFKLELLLPPEMKYNVNFHEINNLFEKHESDIIPFEINSKNNWYTTNPVRPIDNIAGHMAFLKRLPNENFELTTRDLWGFRPEAYNDKWKMDNVFKKAQTQMMDTFGKPFVLTQTNPIEFQKGGDLPKAQGGRQVSKIIKDLSNLTAGKALRTTIYKGVNPANYNVMEKFTGLPSELYRNTVNNSTRPFRTGLSLRFGSPDHLAPFLKEVKMTHDQWNKLPEIDKMNVISAWDNHTLKQINDVGRRRLDAWAVALKQPQEYNTLEQIGDNKYKMLDLEHEPKFFGARHNDIIVNDMKGQDFVGKRDILTGLTKNVYDLEKDPFQLQLNSDDPLANLKRSEFDKLVGNKVLHRPWQQTYYVESSPNSEFETAIYDNDHYGVRGGYRWDVKDTPEGMHWQANDVWDLNPWEKRTTGTLKPHPLTKKFLNANYFKPLQNVEALGLVGGSPFSIENNFIVDPENYKVIKQWEDGGSVDYELGDEIDEATMKRLEQLGYTFEKI